MLATRTKACVIGAMALWVAAGCQSSVLQPRREAPSGAADSLGSAGDTGNPAGSGTASGGGGGLVSDGSGITGGDDPGAGGAAGAAGSASGGGEADEPVAGGETQDGVFDAGSAPDRNRVGAAEICARVAEILCAGEAFCCDNPGRTQQQCQSAQETECAQVDLAEVAADSKIELDMNQLESALTGLEDRASRCDPDIVAWSAGPRGFLSALQGTLGSGEACYPGFSSLTDETTVATWLAACADSATHACLPRSLTDWECAARSEAGGPCFSDLNCAAGSDLYCDNPDLEIGGSASCRARKSNGESCAEGNECSTFLCKGGRCAEATVQNAYCMAN